MDILKAVLHEHSRSQCLKIAEFAGKDALKFARLVDVYLTGPYRVTQRAAWPLGICIQSNPALVLPYLPKLLAFAERTDVHDSVKRNTMRLLQFVEVPRRFRGKVIDLAFRFLQNRKEPVAVRVFSMTVLENLLPDEPDLQRELQIILEDEMPYGSAAFRSRGMKILRKFQAVQGKEKVRSVKN